MSESLPIEVKTLEVLLRRVAKHSASWERLGNVRPWFRGQADAGDAPLPSIFRNKYDEFALNTMFRLKAEAFGTTPDTIRKDRWLFLGQHYGLPTRLLDWTESALFACFFAVADALKSNKPHERYKSPHMGVWMLHPIALNRLSSAGDFPNTWATGNIGSETCRMAFHPRDERDRLIATHQLRPSKYPLAIQASAVDRRVVVQRSCFTIHGTDERDFESMLRETELVRRGQFRKFIIPRTEAPRLLDTLTDMGVSFSTVYPDFTGLADELRHRFGPKAKIRSIKKRSRVRPSTTHVPPRVARGAARPRSRRRRPR